MTEIDGQPIPNEDYDGLIPIYSGDTLVAHRGFHFPNLRPDKITMADRVTMANRVRGLVHSNRALKVAEWTALGLTGADMVYGMYQIGTPRFGTALELSGIGLLTTFILMTLNPEELGSLRDNGHYSGGSSPLFY